MYTHRKLFGHLAKKIGCRALILDYRRIPEHVYPAQVDDAVAAYRWLLDQEIRGGHIALAGDSSGGGLAIGALLRIRALGQPMAAALMTISAWTDMELSGESYQSNRDKDVLFRKEMVEALVGMFLGQAGNRRDPYASPLYGALAGLPPVYMQVGGDEALLDEVGYSPSAQKRLGWMCASMSFRRCCTRSKWLRDVHQKPTMRPADWQTGYGPKLGL
jgi:monoterpene epsilon-lactone hydrolase